MQILSLAAKRGNSVVEETLSILLDRRDPLNAETIANLTGPMCSARCWPRLNRIVLLTAFEELLFSEGRAAGRREVTNGKKLVFGHYATVVWPVNCQLTRV